MLFRLVSKLMLVLMLVIPTAVIFRSNDHLFAAAEDAVEDEVEPEEDEEDAIVEPEEEQPPQGDAGSMTESEQESEDEEEEKPLEKSPDADTTIFFIIPSDGKELPAGDVVKVLVGFSNNGQKEFLVETMDASFRYPQDYSFHIQNFSIIPYERLVEAGRQASFVYQFMPSEMFAGRPFGLAINLNYKDSEGNMFQDAVFNETVNIIESDEGLDGETFFLYVFLAACAVLLLVAGQQLLASFGKKKHGSAKTQVEMGTTNHSDVDYDWLPKERLKEINKSPKNMKGKTSPRQRATKRSPGRSGVESD